PDSVMPSPTKKRKLNNGTKSTAPARGLEYFFSKQKQNGEESSKKPKLEENNCASSDVPTEMTDEELARKLQAEWDQEVANTPHAALQEQTLQLPNKHNVSVSRDESPSPTSTRSKPSIALPTSLNKPSIDNKAKPTLGLQAAGMAEDTTTTSIPFDESPLTFDPAEYVDQLKEHWASEGGNASYALLTRCFILINGTTSRIKIVDTLVNCLRVLIEADPASLLPAVWLATNAISPPYISMELGLGGSAISKALRNACGLDNRALKAIYDKYGDAGDVAFEVKKKQTFTLRKPKPLTIKAVYESLVKIASSQGQGSADTKQRIVDRLLQDARGGEESRFVVRTLCQHLRIGAVKTTMLIALSRAFLLSSPPGADFPLKSVSDLAKLKKEDLAEVWSRAEEIVKACFARRPNYNDLVPVLLEIGISEELLIRCGLALHIPLRPMLGSITRDLSEMLTKLQGRDFACEFKYDGQRAQIHCDENGKVSIFSRHLEVMTDKYPDLVDLIPKIRGEGVDSFIMEGEVVAVDRETGELKNFQTLTNRARKDVDIGAITVDVCMFSFDLMYLNGQPLLDRPFRERRELLRSLFKEIPHHFTWVKSLDATSADSESVLEFFKAATDLKCEGIMVKILDNLPSAPYLEKGEEEGPEGSDRTLTPRSKSKGKDKRLDSWLKVKKDYNSSFDTLDLIPVAAWHGQGRKAKWWSPMLMACRNEETGSLEAVCKCMSGFTDSFYKANRQFYDDGEESGEPKNTRTTQPSFVEYSGPRPDIWFEPQEVWEMAFADITLSPTYTAAIGLVSEERGLSLRFPRFMKKREDKSLEEASTNDFLAGLWRKQEAKAASKKENHDGAGAQIEDVEEADD
ncbi:DNA ligase 1, partial [Fusarium sporotrichioides]